MCKGCTQGMVSRSLELLETDKNYRIAIFLKQDGWKKPTENSYEVWSGGALLYGKTVHCKPDTTITSECFAPTLEEIYAELEHIEIPNMGEFNKLKTAAITWVVENIYKNNQMENLSIEEFKKKHISAVSEGNSTVINYDGKPLLSSDYNRWCYVKEENGQIIHERLKFFKDELENVFINDIAEQLMNGIDRNNLTINIPKEIKKVKIGDKIIEI